MSSGLPSSLFAGSLPVLGDVLDADYREAVGNAEGGDAGEPCHGSVDVGQLAEHAAGLEASEAADVNGRLGVAASREHAVLARPERENVSRVGEIRGGCAVLNRCLDGGEAVMGGDAGGNTLLCLDGDGEGGLEGAGVVLHHHGEIKLLNLLVSKAEADDAGALPDHEGHLLLGHLLGAEYEVSLVLAVVVIDNHHAAARLYRADCPLYPFLVITAESAEIIY